MMLFNQRYCAVESRITRTRTLPEHAKDMPFKGVCPVGEILEVDELME